MAEFEIAELVKDVNVYELACKTNAKTQLSEVEQAAYDNLDAYFKEVGKTGFDRDHQIAAFITHVVNEVIYNEPDELLDMLFDQSTIAEDDDYNAYKTPKNTLVAYEAAKGGNVERSYVDITRLAPKWHNFQIETDISYKDLAKGGWKTVAMYTEYAVAAFKNKMFAAIFDIIDAAIAPGAENYVTISTALPTEEAAQALALYIQDRGDGDGVVVGRSKYIQAISLFKTFVSQDMINEVNRTGRLGTYQGISLVPISSAKKLGNGDALILDKRLFGISGKIGSLVMRGEIKTYQDSDNNKEVIHLMFKDFNWGYSFNEDALDNIVKAVLQ